MTTTTDNTTAALAAAIVTDAAQAWRLSAAARRAWRMTDELEGNEPLGYTREENLNRILDGRTRDAAAEFVTLTEGAKAVAEARRYELAGFGLDLVTGGDTSADSYTRRALRNLSALAKRIDAARDDRRDAVLAEARDHEAIARALRKALKS